MSHPVGAFLSTLSVSSVQPALQLSEAAEDGAPRFGQRQDVTGSFAPMGRVSGQVLTGRPPGSRKRDIAR